MKVQEANRAHVMEGDRKADAMYTKGTVIERSALPENHFSVEEGKKGPSERTEEGDAMAAPRCNFLTQN